MEMKVLTIQEDILGANKEKARRNQEQLDKYGILTANMMSSPGLSLLKVMLPPASMLIRYISRECQ